MIAVTPTPGSGPPYPAWGASGAPGPRFEDEPGWECNAGAPMSRRRTRAVRSSILGAGGHRASVQGGARYLGLPPLRAIALDFVTQNPVAAVERRLEKLGFASPEEARVALLPPLPRCFCVEDPSIPVQRFTRLAPEELVEQALILGLSTAWLFDPGRPVIWTRASLKRRIVLYASQEFYS